MKNFKGGYKIISLEGNDLSTSFSVTGIYDALTETYQKTILVTGIVISGEKKNDAYTEVNVDSTDYKFTVYGYEVTVSSDDSVEAEAVVTDKVTSIGGVSGEITLGTGLEITEEGELSASGGSTLYQHCLFLYVDGGGDNIRILTSIINSKSTPYTSFSDLLADVLASQISGTDQFVSATGRGNHGSTIQIICGIKYENNSFLNYTYMDFSTNAYYVDAVARTYLTVSDTVYKIQ